jgi:hypothetical protein
MLSILFPLEVNCKPIAIVNCHLSAYSPDFHPGFHKEQFTKLVTKAINIVDSKNLNCSYIIGGDTNYRNKNKIPNLLKELYPKRHNLIDVCKKSHCSKLPTQTFRCLHEKGVAKYFAKVVARGLKNSTRKTILSDNRLDLIATDLAIISKTKIIDACKYSDHSAIYCVLMLTTK